MAQPSTESTERPAAERWKRALEQWGIPQEILDNAPSSPWHHSPQMFAQLAERALEETAGPSRRRALEALPEGGSVLDVGVGGGAASLPLAPPAGLLVGVDQSQDMLESFATAADRLGVAHREVQGLWPAAADNVDPVDVVVCHHVLYNVDDLVPFAAALTRRARRRVVVEMTGEHPTSNLNPLWQAIHGLERPTSPTAEDAVAVLEEMGLEVGSEVFQRPWVRPGDDRSEMVAMARRRLCVGPERDAEIEALLDAQQALATRRCMTLWWDGQADPGARTVLL